MSNNFWLLVSITCACLGVYWIGSWRIWYDGLKPAFLTRGDVLASAFFASVGTWWLMVLVLAAETKDTGWLTLIPATGPIILFIAWMTELRRYK